MTVYETFDEISFPYLSLLFNLFLFIEKHAAKIQFNTPNGKEYFISRNLETGTINNYNHIFLKQQQPVVNVLFEIFIRTCLLMAMRANLYEKTNTYNDVNKRTRIS